MKNYIKSKLFVFFLLSITTVCLTSPSLMASNTVTTAEHQKIMTQYIKDLRTLQNQIFSLFESVVNAPPQGSTNLESKVNFIYSQVENLEKSISTYLNSVPRLSAQRRDVLIAFDALNFLENSLYQLTQFIKETNSVERILLLEDFYFLRTSTTETLNRLENIISRE